MKTTSSNRPLLLILVLALLLCAPWLERPFHTRGEPREALVAQAMITTGDWISPPAYDGAVPSKPPFSHWLTAGLSLVSGDVTEVTARLPSALAFVGFVWAFFVFTAKRTSVSSSFVASLILVSSSEWFRSALTCRVDTILATSMAGALMCLYAWWERRFRGVPLVAILLLTCATLTKGPVGFVLPMAIFSLFCWLKERALLSTLPLIVLRACGLGLPVLGITSLWYLLGYMERGDAFIEKVMYENFSRFTSSMADEPHKHSVFYLIAMLALGLLPWSVPLVIPARASRASIKGVVSTFTQRWQSLPDLLQFSSIASLVIVVFFSIPSSKRSVYLLPAYPFIALLVDHALRKAVEVSSGPIRLIAKILLQCTVVVLVAAGVLYLFPIKGMRLDPHAFLQGLTVWKVGSSAVLLILLAWPCRSALRQALQAPVERIAIVTIGAIFCISFFIYDTVAWQLSPKSWLDDLRAHAGSMEQQERLFSFGSEAYGASFYLRKPFARADAATLKEGDLVFLESKSLNEFREKKVQAFREIFRYHSGIENTKKDVVVVQVTQ